MVTSTSKVSPEQAKADWEKLQKATQAMQAKQAENSRTASKFEDLYKKKKGGKPAQAKKTASPASKLWISQTNLSGTPYVRLQADKHNPAAIWTDKALSGIEVAPGMDKLNTPVLEITVAGCFPVTQAMRYGHNQMRETTEREKAKNEEVRVANTTAGKIAAARQNSFESKIASDVQPAVSLVLGGTGIKVAAVAHPWAQAAGKTVVPFVKGAFDDVKKQAEESQKKEYTSEHIDLTTAAGLSKLNLTRATVSGLAETASSNVPAAQTVAGDIARKALVAVAVDSAKEATKYATTYGKEGEVTLGGVIGTVTQEVSSGINKELTKGMFGSTPIANDVDLWLKKYGLVLKPAGAPPLLKINKDKTVEFLKSTEIPEFTKRVQDLANPNVTE